MPIPDSLSPLRLPVADAPMFFTSGPDQGQGVGAVDDVPTTKDLIARLTEENRRAVADYADQTRWFV